MVLLTATCFGQGGGPLVVGAANDYVRPELGVDPIRYWLLAAAATSFVGALFFVWAARSIREGIIKASSAGRALLLRTVADLGHKSNQATPIGPPRPSHHAIWLAPIDPWQAANRATSTLDAIVSRSQSL